jgi:hypothetical membrane protein
MPSSKNSQQAQSGVEIPRDKPSQTLDLHNRTLVGGLAVAGMIGPVIFVVSFLVAGALRPGYSPLRQAISALGTGPNGWIEIASAETASVLITVFAIGLGVLLWPSLSTVWRWTCASLLSLPGVGLIIAGFTDNARFRFTHTMASQAGLWGAVLAFLLFGIALYRARRWRPWSVYSLFASAATLVLLAVTFAGLSPGAPLADYGGLLERLVVIEVLAWYLVFGWKVLREARAGGSSTGSAT